MRKPHVGDVIEVPLGGSDDAARAVVLFVSKHFKDVMLIGAPAPTDRNKGPFSLPELCDVIRVLVYTSQLSVSAGRWEVVGAIEVEAAEFFSERIVGENVWISDDVARKATSEERGTLPLMSVAGEGAVEKLLRQVLLDEERSRMTKLVAGRSTALLSRLRGRS